MDVKFFTGHSSSDPVIAAVARFVKEQNEKYNFLSSLTKRIGFPYWDKSIVVAKSYSAKGSSADSANVVYIPFARDTEQRVNAALIIAMKSTDTSFRFLYDWQYAAYGFDTTSHTEKWNARDVFHIFTLFDKSVFNTIHFRITDNNLLTSSEKETIRISGLNADSVEVLYTLKEYGRRGNNAQELIPIETCDPYSVCIQPCPKDQARGASTNSLGYCCEIALEMEECTTYYFDTGGGGGGEIPPPPDSGSGGGGGGSGDPGSGWDDPCSGSPALPRGEIVEPCGDPGWLPMPPDDSNTFYPYAADIVILDTSITKNFPCIKKIIDSLTGYSNVNALAQVALNTVFGVNEKIHLTFKSEPNLPYNIDGDTKPDSSYLVGSDFYATIRLNSWMLSHSTQEYIAATVIHEAIHAYIDFKQYQYQVGLIDSTTFKALFPLFWPPKTLYQSGGVNYYSTSELAQHNAMAANLIGIMSDALKGLFPNPYISSTLRDSIYRSLSWGGLDQTKLWQNKTDTCDIKAINVLAKDTSLKTPFVLLGSTSCTKQYLDDFKSLHLKTGCQ